MLSKLTIKRKLFASAAAMLVLTCILGYYGLSSNSMFREQFDTAVDKTVRKIDLADAIALANSDMISAQSGTMLGALARDPKEVETNEQAFRQGSELIQKSLSEIRPLLTKEEAKALTTDLEKQLADWQPHHEDLARNARAGAGLRPTASVRTSPVRFTNKSVSTPSD
jgi:CHASE3 domain sensor protein